MKSSRPFYYLSHPILSVIYDTIINIDFIQWPIRHGIIDDWDLMERFYEQVIFKYLRCEPEDHYFLLVSILSVVLSNLEKLLILYCQYIGSRLRSQCTLGASTYVM